ncbi:MAG: hypothetical protein ABSG46_18195, partial [Candidatus Binataceae bacterium]
ERYQAIIRRLAEMQVKMEQAEAAIKRGALVMTAEEWDAKGRAQLRLSIEKVRAKQAAKASG